MEATIVDDPVEIVACVPIDQVFGLQRKTGQEEPLRETPNSSELKKLRSFIRQQLRMAMVMTAALFAVGLQVSAQDSSKGASQSAAESGGNVRKVPSLRARPVHQAKQKANFASLQLVQGRFYIAPTKWRPEIRPAHIYLQTPRAGKLVRAGDVIAAWSFVKATQDQRILQMPDLRGKSTRQALEDLARLKLPLIQSAQTDPGPNNSRVTSQYPRPNQSIYEGTSVFLVFGDSKKPQRVSKAR